MSIEQHIEELRSELKACLDAEELVQIEAEMRAAMRELSRLEAREIGAVQRLHFADRVWQVL